ncbi:hypothetical protein N865_05485 [Intrasporangium oryzae NRRL B-24470]|uniref:Uncharacterized protein n=1 Tax=Intrasporangium oryzae NRRL B-24470 TaxID=1386089 RepID=W9G5C6_9MICO|nr:hypothetical protein [Intrasporangium oryzae]EWT01235.1 hypothetical protein N865_05485 [Intrasporangium oryzae NRRL B-24470]
MHHSGGRAFRFHGQIAGVGSTSGVRVVVGRWERTPLGSFADAMVETAPGHRVLLAPNADVAEFVRATYEFDEVRVEPFAVEATPDRWVVDSPTLSLELTVGARMPLGRLLRVVPAPVAASPTWAKLVDPIARIALRGVRTAGMALEGRREYYGATDVHAVTGIEGRFDGEPIGALAPVDPPCRFGFSSTPRRPSVTDVVTTVVRSH